jgi:hypothetical protein
MYNINWGLERRDPGNMSAGKLTQPYYIFQDLIYDNIIEINAY